jgi:hypothetical protein
MYNDLDTITKTFESQGFCVIEDFVSERNIEALRQVILIF